MVLDKAAKTEEYYRLQRNVMWVGETLKALIRCPWQEITAFMLMLGGGGPGSFWEQTK